MRLQKVQTRGHEKQAIGLLKRQAKGCKQTGKGQKKKTAYKDAESAIKGARKNGHKAAKITGKGA
jgi:hypothetical protein